MPPKVRVVKNSIGTEDIGQFVKSFAYAISRGELDTHLDVIYEMVVDRVTSFQGPGDSEDPEVIRKLSQIRILRKPSTDLTLGGVYTVTGERYRGVTVKYHGKATKSTPERPLARVEVVSAGQSGLEEGAVKLIPLAALNGISLAETLDNSADVTRIEKI